MPHKDPIVRKRWEKEYHKKHREHRRTYRIGKRYQDKLEVFQHYSNGKIECACCGERMMKFLTIDHINNDGVIIRKGLKHQGRGMAYYQWLKRNKFPPGLQILCWNCNCGKALNNGICPHKEI